MCGIAGYFLLNRSRRDGVTVRDMIGTIAHRGPDDEGYAFFNTTSGSRQLASGPRSHPSVKKALQANDGTRPVLPHDVAMGHCRFSIVDLSPLGHQPMIDATTGVALSFNGEIYNYIELRLDLIKRGWQFETNSDTEVLLKSYLEWGPVAFDKMNGFWAVALYDGRRRSILLARDRLGKTPLYYCVHQGVFYWSSEIKAILASTEITDHSVKRKAVMDYLILGMRDHEGTFWDDIHDFPPASYSWIKDDLSLDTTRYWSIPQRRRTPEEMPLADVQAAITDLLTDAVRIRLRVDVPVAFELSGGLDSSSLVALHASQSSTITPAYTIKNEDPEFDEEPYARSIAEHFRDRVEYRVIHASEVDFWRGADSFVYLQEEPFHSPVLYTSHTLRRIIRNDGIKVVLSGAAGDELLAGYANEYFIPYLRHLVDTAQCTKLLRELRRNTEISISNLIKSHVTKSVKAPLTSLAVRAFGIATPLDKILKVKDRPRYEPSDSGSLFTDVMVANMSSRKMYYWLRAGNKSNMGIPIEARAPFLDYRLVDLCFCLPPEYLVRDGWHKWILRDLVKGLMPTRITWRRTKMGYPFPLKSWLAGSRATVRDMLSGVDNDFVDFGKMMLYYDYLLEVNAAMLWRMISFGLWWRRIVKGESL